MNSTLPHNKKSENLYLQINVIHKLLTEIATSIDGSLSQKQYLEQLLKLTAKYPQIQKYRYYYPQHFDDALNLTLEALSSIDRKSSGVSGQSIRQFLQKVEQQESITPQKVVQWYLQRVIRILKNKIADLHRKEKFHLSLDAPLPNNPKIRFVEMIPNQDCGGLEEIIQQEEQQFLRELRQHLANDPQGQLTQCYLKDYPQCNARELVRGRLLKEPVTNWSDLADTLNVPYGTMTSFWHRKCKPLVQEVTVTFLEKGLSTPMLQER